MKEAYREFEERLGQTSAPRGTKSELVVAAIARRTDAFRVADLQRDCPGVSVDMIRRVLKTLRASGKVQCLSRGRDATWKRVGRWKQV